MSLHRDCEYQIRLVRRGIQGLADLAGENGILCPVFGRKLHLWHVFQSGEVIKTQVGVHIIAAIERGAVIVDGMGGVAVFF